MVDLHFCDSNFTNEFLYHKTYYVWKLKRGVRWYSTWYRFFSEKIAHWVFQIIYKDVCHNFLLAHSLSKKKSSFTHIDVIKGVMIHQKSNLYATCHMGQNDMFVYEKFSMPFWHITRPSYMTLKLLVRIFFVSKNSF